MESVERVKRSRNFGHEPAGLVQKSVGIGMLVPNPRNPRSHPEKQITRLVAAVRRFGQVRDILVRQQNMMIIGGHGVWEACRRAGMAEVKVLVWACSQEDADAYMITDNHMAELARDDNDLIAQILQEQSADELPSLGYSQQEAAKIVEDMLGSEMQVTEDSVEFGPVRDFFWISVRGPLSHQAVMLDALKAAMVGLDGVEVYMGSTVTDL